MFGKALTSRRRFDPESPEMMDRPDVNPQLLRKQLQSLRVINRYFGGHHAYKAAFRTLYQVSESATVLDLCTGSGDHPGYLLQHYPKLSFIAADFQWETLQTAKKELSGIPYHALQADALNLPLKDHSVDYSVCSLALHHFSEEQAVQVMSEMSRVSRKGGVVIDLTRGPIAYGAIWLLTALWLNDPYTSLDGRASVLAAFRPNELIHLAKSAGWNNYWHATYPWFRQAIGFRKQF